MKTNSVTHYDLLDVAQNASTEEIRKAYRRAVRTAHPDRGGHTGIFMAVTFAYEVLAAADSRLEYDRFLRGVEEESPPGSARRPAKRSAAYEQAQQPGPTPALKADVSRMLFAQAPVAAASFRPAYGKSIRRQTDRHVWPAKIMPRTLKSGLVLAVMVFGLSFLQGSSSGIGYGVAGFVSVMICAALLGLVLSAIVALFRLPGSRVRADKLVPRDIAMNQVFGEPGRGLSGARFGERQAELGKQGERATHAVLAETLLPLMPAARLLHSMQWPGSRHADIDHVMVAGKRIALIDSKQWRDGNYWWDNRTLFRSGKELNQLKFGYAVAKMAAAFPDCQVQGWVVIHTAAGDPRSPYIENHDGYIEPGRLPVRLVNAQALAEEVGLFLSHPDHVAVTDLTVLSRLLPGLKP